MLSGGLWMMVALVFAAIVLVVAFVALARVATPLGIVLALVVFVSVIGIVGMVYFDVVTSRARNSAREIERVEKLLGPGRSVAPAAR